MSGDIDKTRLAELDMVKAKCWVQRSSLYYSVYFFNIFEIFPNVSVRFHGSDSQYMMSVNCHDRFCLSLSVSWPHPHSYLAQLLFSLASILTLLPIYYPDWSQRVVFFFLMHSWFSQAPLKTLQGLPIALGENLPPLHSLPLLTLHLLSLGSGYTVLSGFWFLPHPSLLPWRGSSLSPECAFPSLPP